MPEPQNSTALTTIDGEHQVEVREADAAGHFSTFKTALPTSARFQEWSVMQQAIMLKKGAWKASPMTEVIYAIAYANSKGLDIMAGDVFPTGNGRIGTSNKAKIKLALATGNIEGIETETKELGQLTPALPGCASKVDLQCTVKIHVKGWKVPITRTAKLSRWYKAGNPNWQGNPEHMLELNTIAHAIEYVNPVATEDDEAPPPRTLAEAIDNGAVGAI